MKKIILLGYITILIFSSCDFTKKNEVQQQWELPTRNGAIAISLSIDSMDLKNPFIYMDRPTATYYMTGDGGDLWISKNLSKWTGPYFPLQLDSTMWMGVEPIITSAEIHKYNNRYYYMATFTRPDIIIDNVAGSEIPRRSCQLFVSDSIQGPYKPLIADKPLLKAAESSVDATFCTDEYNVGYLIYNHQWTQNWNGTIQIIRLSDDFSKQIGEPYIMFSASSNPWSIGKDSLGAKSFSPVMEGAFLFDTEEKELGMLFSTYINDRYTLGVAYSEKNQGLNGPWHIEPEPLLDDNSGHAMMFNDFDGTLVMVLHKDTIVEGRSISRPRLLEMDNQFDKLKIKGDYKY